MPGRPPTAALRLRRLRVDPLLRFALLSAALLAVLGLVTGRVLADQVRQRTIADATDTAQIVSALGMEPQLSVRDVVYGLPPNEVAHLDATFRRSGLLGTKVVKVVLWNRQAQSFYDSGVSAVQVDSRTHAVDFRTSNSEELRNALAGHVASEVTGADEIASSSDHRAEAGLLRRYGQVLEVYVPLRFGRGGPPAGAFEIYMPYRPVAAAIAADVRRLYLVLAIGLAVLWGVLFRIVAAASSALRRQRDELGRQAVENRHLALHDALTGLPNRALFLDRAAHAIAAAGRDGHAAAVLLLDLDRFKDVNDTLGHVSGDSLLREVADRLAEHVRGADTVARLGGDEFGVVLRRVDHADEVAAVAARLLEAIGAPVTLAGISFDVKGSVGAALFPEHGADVETLLQRADVAMYLAKAARDGYQLYAPDRDDSSPERLSLAADIRHAAARGELVLHYQPKVDIRSGEVRAAEALVRWQHPERGLLYPDAFIPLAEQTGAISSITMAVLDAALAQVAAWRADGLALAVSVNLSTHDVVNLDLPAAIAALLARRGLGGESLELEITESLIMAKPMQARAVLTRLRDMGIRVAIDDFGTGYSSLSYLNQLPVTEIKIDRSFVTHMAESVRDEAIVRSTIDLCENLGLEIVAEGIETAETWDRLAALGCTTAQGYLISRPLPAEELTRWVAERSTPGAPPLRKSA